MALDPYSRIPGFPNNVAPFLAVNGPGGTLFFSTSRTAAEQVARAVKAYGGQAWVSDVYSRIWPSWARSPVAASVPGVTFIWGYTSANMAQYVAGLLADRTSYKGRRIRLDAFSRAMGF